MSTQKRKYEDLSDDEIANARRLAKKDDELGPVFEAMLEDVVEEDYS